INYSECDSPEEQLQESEQLEQLRLIIDELDEQEQQVIRMRYGIGVERSMTLEEVGEQLGCTRERVRQIQSKALAKLQLKRQRVF
ncbi:MAG: sigma-70 family RNA polymerase sigma factor, partial [Victivallaceae bacterium]